MEFILAQGRIKVTDSAQSILLEVKGPDGERIANLLVLKEEIRRLAKAL